MAIERLSLTPAMADRYHEHQMGNLNEQMAASLWPTPDAKLHRSGSDFNRPNRPNSGGHDLTTAVALDPGMWPTPRKEGFDAGQHSGYVDSLPVAVRLFPTPTIRQGGATIPPGSTIDGETFSTPAGRKLQIALHNAIEHPEVSKHYPPPMWPTCTVQDGENTAGPSQWTRNSDPLNVAVLRNPDGSPPDEPTRVNYRLHARWVNRLMGFPDGWLEEEDHVAHRSPATDSRQPANAGIDGDDAGGSLGPGRDGRPAGRHGRADGAANGPANPAADVPDRRQHENGERAAGDDRGCVHPPYLDPRWRGNPLAAWDGNWELGMPRVVSSEKDRVGKLKSLGNAIVPQVALVLLTAIREADAS